MPRSLASLESSTYILFVAFSLRSSKLNRDSGAELGSCSPSKPLDHRNHGYSGPKLPADGTPDAN